MDATELKGYEQQLAQVQGALRSDPDNSELRTLEGELQNLIDLTKQLLGAQSSGADESSARASGPAKAAHTSTSSKPSAVEEHRYSVGDECQAKYEADGRWYTARVVAITGAAQKPMYTVLYRGYDQTEVVTAASLRPLTKSGGGAGSHTTHVSTGSSSSASKASAARTAEDEAERERKKRRSEKKAGRFATRTAEVEAVQSSWQKFAKKAEKKGGAGGARRAGGGGSMFKTPDDPLAKVGVVGAGRGMTQYGDRKKHGYDRDAAPLG